MRAKTAGQLAFRSNFVRRYGKTLTAKDEKDGRKGRKDSSPLRSSRLLPLRPLR